VKSRERGKGSDVLDGIEVLRETVQDAARGDDVEVAERSVGDAPQRIGEELARGSETSLEGGEDADNRHRQVEQA
jgi:hypothetical protein